MYLCCNFIAEMCPSQPKELKRLEAEKCYLNFFYFLFFKKEELLSIIIDDFNSLLK
jgi:hypothetical protein